MNEAEISAQLDKMQSKSAKLEQQLKETSDPAKWAKLNTELGTVNGKIGTLEKQMSGQMAPTLRQMEQGLSRMRNELKYLETGSADFTKKLKEIGTAEAALKKVQTDMAGVRKAMDETNKSAGVFAGIKDKFKELAAGIPGIGAAFTALTGPVGIVVGLFVGLIAILKQNAEFADELSFAFEGIKNVVRTLADQLMGLIKNGFERLKNAINDPKQALKDLGEAIQNNILTRFKAFGVFLDAISLALEGRWKDAAKKATDAVLQLGTGVENVTGKVQQYGKEMAEAYKRGDQSARMMDQMTVKQAELANAIERTNIAIAQQTTIMKDAQKTDAERLAAADRVIQMETTNANRRMQMINLEIAALRKKQDQLVLSGEEEAKLINLNTQLLQAQVAKEDAIRKATLLKAQLEAEIASNTIGQVMTEAITQVNLAVQGTGKEFEKVATVQVPMFFTGVYKQFNNLAKWLKSGWGQAVQAGIQAVNDITGSALQISENVTNRKLQNIDVTFNKEAAKLKERYELGIISERVYNAQLEALQKQKAQKEADLKKQQFKAQKGANIAMAIMNTANAVVNALATAPWPVNIVMAALAAATGAAQIGVIASTPMPQFAKGGKLAGPRHSEGGIPVAVGNRVVAEAEGDEWIINRQSSSDYHHALDAINKNDSSIQWLKGFPRLHMPYAVAGGQLQMHDGGPMSSVSNNNDSLKKHIAHGNKLQVQAAKYIVDGIVSGLSDTGYKRRRI